MLYHGPKFQTHVEMRINGRRSKNQTLHKMWLDKTSFRVPQQEIKQRRKTPQEHRKIADWMDSNLLEKAA